MFLANRNSKIMELVNKISVEKHISKHIILDALKEGYEKIFEKILPQAQININFNSNLNTFEILRNYKIVKKIKDQESEITLSKAKKAHYEIKNKVAIELVDTSKFSRRIVNQFGQIIKQIIREAEKKSIYEQFKFYLHKLYRGKINLIEASYILIEVERTYAFLPKKNCLFNDNFKVNDYIDFYVEDVLEKTKKPAQIIASRTHPEFLRCLFKQEIPEIFQNIILIKDIARDPGIRAKVSVYTNDRNIDPVGSCIGNNGYRIKKISEQINYESIDIVKYSDDLSTYVQNIFLPAKISFVKIDEMKRKITIYLPKNQLSLAIGKKGSIIKLCSMFLKRYKLDLVDDCDVDIEKLKKENSNNDSLNSIQTKSNLNLKDKKIIQKEKIADKKQIFDLEKERIKKETKEILEKIANQKKSKSKPKPNLIKQKTQNEKIKSKNLKEVNVFSKNIKETKKIIKPKLILEKKSNLKKQQKQHLETKKTKETLKKKPIQIQNNLKNNINKIKNDKLKVLKPKKTKKTKNVIKKPIIKIDKNLKIDAKQKELFKKYKREFNLLATRIELLNDEKYKNNQRAQEIKLIYINLYQYFNDANQNIENIKLYDFLKMQQEISLSELKKCHQYITRFEKEFKKQQFSTKFKK